MAVYLKDGMVLLDSGFIAIDTACCCGGVCVSCDSPCCCVTTSAFEGDGGLFWTRVETDCDASVHFSGPTTECARYATIVETKDCCPPESGSSSCTQTAFCNDVGFGPFCDIFLSPGCEDPVPCVARTVQEVFDLVSTPCDVPGPCCIAGVCSVLTPEACFVAGGTWNPQCGCTPNPC